MKSRMEPSLFELPGDSMVCLPFWNAAVNTNLKYLSADKTVKVPEMAESISEGTLKQWSKSQ